MKNKIAFALIMGAITTGIISFTLVAVNIGFNEKFLLIWLRSWGMAYLVVIPTILIVSPKVQKLVDYWFKEKDEKKS
jgi:integral membrane sensor domain MASE1